MLTDLPLFSVLKTRMSWHQARQTVLAENVANADTPGFGARDLRAPRFDVPPPSASRGLSTALTNARHITGTGPAPDTAAGVERAKGWEVTPEGNGVVLEEQMMHIAQNQMDHQLATTLYSRSMGILRMAVSRRG